MSFTKGCYPGQELVERMDSRGSTAPKNLRLLTGAIVENAKSGDAVIVNGESVGINPKAAGDLQGPRAASYMADHENLQVRK